MNARVLIFSACAALAIAGCDDDDEASTTSGEDGATATDAAERSKPKVELPKALLPRTSRSRT